MLHERRFEITNCDIKATPSGRGYFPANSYHSGPPRHAGRGSGGTLWCFDKEAERSSSRGNAARFPEDFIFQLTVGEAESLRSQFATSNGRGGRRYLPYAFTEQGVAMLSSVLGSEQAIQVNVAIMRAFVLMRRMLVSHEELARKVDALEGKYDSQFRVVFDAIRALMESPKTPRRRIGF
ncbi:MAG: ORF6N domain-containing protein [Candidatus Peribacteraceae bacterium]